MVLLCFHEVLPFPKVHCQLLSYLFLGFLPEASFALLVHLVWRPRRVVVDRHGTSVGTRGSCLAGLNPSKETPRGQRVTKLSQPLGYCQT